jgi:hypothetical protein
LLLYSHHNIDRTYEYAKLKVRIFLNYFIF